MEWFNLLFGGGQVWVEAALLVCLFWAALVKPERIRSLMEFRIASLLLAAAIVAPIMVQLAFVSMNQFGAGTRPLPPFGTVRPPGGGANVDMTIYGLAVPPLVLTVAVILAVDSVIPRTRGSGG